MGATRLAQLQDLQEVFKRVDDRVRLGPLTNGLATCGSAIDDARATSSFAGVVVARPNANRTHLRALGARNVAPPKIPDVNGPGG